MATGEGISKGMLGSREGNTREGIAVAENQGTRYEEIGYRRSERGKNDMNIRKNCERRVSIRKFPSISRK